MREASRFKPGDVLFAVDTEVTLNSTNSATIEVGDFALFRPDVAGNYAAGEFYEVYDGLFGDPPLTAGTLVERAITVGGLNLRAGDMVISKAGDTNVYVFRPTSLGVASTSGNYATLLTSGVQVDGLDLIERATRVGDVIVDAGTLLISTDQAAVVGGAGGSVNVLANDIFTYQFDNSGNAASLFFEAIDVGLSSVNENVDAIAINYGTTVLAAVDDSFGVNEGGTLSDSVAPNDEVFNPSTSMYTLVTTASHGSVIVQADGSFEYIHNGSETTSDSFAYRVTDAAGNTSTATVTIGVSPQNDDPTAGDDSFGTMEDNVLSDSLANNDSDDDGDSLDYTLVSSPSDGTVTLNLDGTFTYTPNANFNGNDSFIYQVDDGHGGIAAATATIAVSPQNDDPTAGDDSFSTTEDNVLSGSVASNDSDDDGDSLDYTLVSAPSDGTVTLNLDGTFTYTPNANFNGNDSFIYQVDDGNGGLAMATAAIAITPENDSPVAVDDSFSTNEDIAITSTVAPNDHDTEDATLTFHLLTNANHGTLTLAADGSFSYTPDANFNGIDTFRYEAIDSGGHAATATVTIDIAAVNDAPIVVDDNFVTTRDAAVSGSVATNDHDVEDNTMVYALETPPNQGMISFLSDGSFTFTPTTGFTGTTSFTYTATDMNNVSSVGTADILVQDINDAPNAQDEAFTTPEDQPLSGSVATNDTDANGDTLTYSLVNSPTYGQVQLAPNGSFLFRPAPNMSGSIAFSYQATDPEGASSTAVATITVTPENDAPVAIDDELAASANSPLSIMPSQLLDNDSDLEGDGLNVVFVDAPQNGELRENSDGSFEYVPDDGFIGVDTFTYHVTDGSTPSAPATVSITVIAPPPSPTTPVDSETEIENEATNESEGDSNGSGQPTVEALIGNAEGTSDNSDEDDSNLMALLNGSLDNDTEDDGVFIIDTATEIKIETADVDKLTFIVANSSNSGVELVSNTTSVAAELMAVELAELQTLDFAAYLQEGKSYSAIAKSMDHLRESLETEVVLPELAFQAATSSFSVGAALWLLRGGYIVASVISALPAWQTFDPIPILAYATKEEGETVESLMEG